jgi:hypothetical protein
MRHLSAVCGMQGIKLGVTGQTDPRSAFSCESYVCCWQVGAA